MSKIGHFHYVKRDMTNQAFFKHRFKTKILPFWIHPSVYMDLNRQNNLLKVGKGANFVS